MSRVSAPPRSASPDDTATGRPWPPGQQERPDFPRFGHTAFATRFPAEPGRLRFQLAGDVQQPLQLGRGSDSGGDPAGDPAVDWQRLPRHTQCSDFHCVTTWSRRGLHWAGVRFADFHAQVAVARAGVHPDATLVEFHALDGYRTALPLADLLAADVLLADTLDDQPLPLAHGAPLRLVAPAHYGYKSLKHLKRICYWTDPARHTPVGPAFMAHPRARVAEEERGQLAPGWLLRWLYRPLIRPTAAQFRSALERHARGG